MANGNYLMPWDITQNTTEANEDVVVPAGTARKLVFKLGTALVANQTAKLTIRKNGVDTALTCTITGAAGGVSSCTDSVNVITFADGDMLSILYNETATGGASTPNTRVKYMFLFAAN
jgi:hypothetical protein